RGKAACDVLAVMLHAGARQDIAAEQAQTALGRDGCWMGCGGGHGGIRQILGGDRLHRRTGQAIGCQHARRRVNAMPAARSDAPADGNRCDYLPASSRLASHSATASILACEPTVFTRYLPSTTRVGVPSTCHVRIRSRSRFIFAVVASDVAMRMKSARLTPSRA